MNPEDKHTDVLRGNLESHIIYEATEISFEKHPLLDVLKYPTSTPK
jgi:hypothetical protein